MLFAAEKQFLILRQENKLFWQPEERSCKFSLEGLKFP